MPTTTTIPVTAGSGINLDAVQVTVSATAVARENICVSDPTSATAIAAVKDASTQAATTDGSMVVQINPNQPNLTTALNVHDASPASQAVTNAGTFAVQVSATGSANSKTNPIFSSLADGTNQLTAALSALGTAPTGTEVMAVNAVNLPTTAAGGALSAVVKSAQATAVNIKASAGNLYGMAIQSATATAGFVMFFNTATTATTGTVWAIPIAASGSVIIPPGLLALLNFGTGIAINVASPINGTTTQITWTGTIMYL